MKNKRDYRAMVYKRWRNELGIRIVCNIKPSKGIQRAVCKFEDNQFIGEGTTNIQALNNVFNAINNSGKI